MEIRELVPEDMIDLLDLCRRTLPLDQWSYPTLRRRVLQEPNHRPAYQLVATSEGRLMGTILGSTRESEQGAVGGVRLIAVDNAFQRRGIATALLATLEDRMRANQIVRLRAGGIAPSYFWPGVDMRYTPAFCFFQRHGFTRQGEGINMAVDLAGADLITVPEEQRLAAEGFAFRRLDPDDREEFGAWLRTWWGENWYAEGLASYENQPISTFIAIHQGRICAFASYNVAALDGGFGPTGTEPSLQGRGVGRVLLLRCLDDLRKLGFSQAEICWTGPITFYARAAGAVMSRYFMVMEKEL
jgi:mycothiol synthase